MPLPVEIPAPVNTKMLEARCRCSTSAAMDVSSFGMVGLRGGILAGTQSQRELFSSRPWVMGVGDFNAVRMKRLGQARAESGGLTAACFMGRGRSKFMALTRFGRFD